MSWYRFECVTKWQNQPYTNNANPQLFYPAEIKLKPDKIEHKKAELCRLGSPDMATTQAQDLSKLVKTFCPVNAGKYRNNGKTQN